jgi:hypothetical protein
MRVVEGGGESEVFLAFNNIMPALVVRNYFSDNGRKLFESEFAADYAMSRELSDYEKDKYVIRSRRERRLLSWTKR